MATPSLPNPSAATTSSRNPLLRFAFLAACALGLTACVQRETPMPNRPAGVAYFLDKSVSPDRQWSLANVAAPQSQRSLRRGEPRKTDLALVRVATGKRVFDFAAFERRLQGTRVFVELGAFPQPPAWSPDSARLAIPFHNHHTEDLYVVQHTKQGWREVALPRHNLRPEFRRLPELNGRSLDYRSEQLTALTWKSPVELHATYGAWLPPYFASVRYAYIFAGSRIGLHVIERKVVPKPGKSE